MSPECLHRMQRFSARRFRVFYDDARASDQVLNPCTVAGPNLSFTYSLRLEPPRCGREPGCCTRNTRCSADIQTPVKNHSEHKVGRENSDAIRRDWQTKSATLSPESLLAVSG